VLDVRQEAMRTFISIMKAIPNKEFLELSIQFLTSNNWRIREEILNLIIINTLNKIDSDFDYEGVIKAISKLVNDDNAKVRFVSRESLAILANKGDRETVLDL
jgi:HEAT repeat protein